MPSHHWARRRGRAACPMRSRSTIIGRSPTGCATRSSDSCRAASSTAFHAPKGPWQHAGPDYKARSFLSLRGQTDKDDAEADAGDAEPAGRRDRLAQHEARGSDDPDELRGSEDLCQVERHPAQQNAVNDAATTEQGEPAYRL